MKYIRKSRVKRRSERLVLVFVHLCGLLDSLIYICSLTYFSGDLKRQALMWEKLDRWCD